jgi:hypothetical protein
MSAEERRSGDTGGEATRSELVVENDELKHQIIALRQELLEVRATMLARITMERARRQVATNNANIVRNLGSGKEPALRALVQRVHDVSIVDKHMSAHERSIARRDAAIRERRKASHSRLMRRRLVGSKGKKVATKVLPNKPVSQGVGTNACDVHDFTVEMQHGPMGLHLEESHDCKYGTYVASVMPESQASSLKLQTGDILTSVGDEVLQDIHFDDAIQMLMASDRPLRLGFRRRLTVFCDHAEGKDGSGTMHGRIFSLDLGAGEIGFELAEQTNSTLSEVRFDCCVQEVYQHGLLSGAGLRAGDILLGLNGDSAGDLGFEDTHDLLLAAERPACLHFFRFEKGDQAFELGTDYLHEDVISVLQYTDMVVHRGNYAAPEGVSFSKKERKLLKVHADALARLDDGRNELIGMLEKDALHTARSSVVMGVASMRGLFRAVDDALADVLTVVAKHVVKNNKKKKR